MRQSAWHFAMSSSRPKPEDLFEKIRELPPETLADVEDFVDFLRSKDEDLQLRRVVTAMSERALEKAWGPEDDVYDQL